MHQLRGRVGRGQYESYCFLLVEKCERLDGFCRTNDGFEIARQDLTQRGAGELMGAMQSGMDELMNGLMSAGPELIEETHEEARQLLRGHLARGAADGAGGAAVLRRMRLSMG